MVDKYDKAINILCAIEDEGEFRKAVSSAWFNAGADPEGVACLFAYACQDINGPTANPDGKQTGCLSMIRGSSYYHAWTQELTNEIRADERIPDRTDNITRDNLCVFAEWQRRLDREVRNQEGE